MSGTFGRLKVFLAQDSYGVTPSDHLPPNAGLPAAAVVPGQQEPALDVEAASEPVQDAVLQLENISLPNLSFNEPVSLQAAST